MFAIGISGRAFAQALHRRTRAQQGV